VGSQLFVAPVSSGMRLSEEPVRQLEVPVGICFVPECPVFLGGQGGREMPRIAIIALAASNSFDLRDSSSLIFKRRVGLQIIKKAYLPKSFPGRSAIGPRRFPDLPLAFEFHLLVYKNLD